MYEMFFLRVTARCSLGHIIRLHVSRSPWRTPGIHLFGPYLSSTLAGKYKADEGLRVGIALTYLRFLCAVIPNQGSIQVKLLKC